MSGVTGSTYAHEVYDRLNGAQNAAPDTAAIHAIVQTDAEEVDLDTLYRRYQRTVFAYLRRMTGDAEEAQDLTQEVFLKAYRRPPHGAKARYPRAWLLQIATHTCIDHFRRRRARVTTQSTPDYLEAHSPTDPFEQSQTAAAVSESLRRLSARHRAAIILKDIHGLKHTEIAAAMNISEGAAQVLLHRARSEFREIFLGLSPVAAGCPVAHRLATDLVGAELTLGQRRELREHAKTCPECGRHLERGRMPAGALGFLLAPLFTPSDLAGRLTSLLGDKTWGSPRLNPSWLDRMTAHGAPAAESALRMAGPTVDHTIQLSAKLGALLMAVAIVGAGSLGALGLGTGGSPSSGGGADSRADHVAAASPTPAGDDSMGSRAPDRWSGMRVSDAGRSAGPDRWGVDWSRGPLGEAAGSDTAKAQNMAGQAVKGEKEHGQGTVEMSADNTGGVTQRTWTSPTAGGQTGPGPTEPAANGSTMGPAGEAQSRPPTPDQVEAQTTGTGTTSTGPPTGGSDTTSERDPADGIGETAPTGATGTKVGGGATAGDGTTGGSGANDGQRGALAI